MKRFLGLLLVILLAAVAWGQSGLSLPVGTALKMTLDKTLSTATSQVGDTFSGRVNEAVKYGGRTVIPTGSIVQGRVTKVSEPRRIAGKPTLGLFPETVTLPDGEQYLLNAVLIDTSLRDGSDVNEEGQFKGAGHDRKDVIKTGMGTGGGMIVGGLIGGGAGVAVGGLIGAGATGTHWLLKHRTATLPAGTELVLELSRPLTLGPASGGQ
jgi:hypothetical protein